MFTYGLYEEFINKLKQSEYGFGSFSDCDTSKYGKVYLRHDVDIDKIKGMGHEVRLHTGW